MTFWAIALKNKNKQKKPINFDSFTQAWHQRGCFICFCYLLKRSAWSPGASQSAWSITTVNTDSDSLTQLVIQNQTCTFEIMKKRTGIRGQSWGKLAAWLLLSWLHLGFVWLIWSPLLQSGFVYSAGQTAPLKHTIVSLTGLMRNT